jgi:hypothetical protein
MAEGASLFRPTLATLASSNGRHREERSDAAIQQPVGKAGWLRFARHDERRMPELSQAESALGMRIK